MCTLGCPLQSWRTRRPTPPIPARGSLNRSIEGPLPHNFSPLGIIASTPQHCRSPGSHFSISILAVFSFSIKTTPGETCSCVKIILTRHVGKKSIVSATSRRSFVSRRHHILRRCFGCLSSRHMRCFGRSELEYSIHNASRSCIRIGRAVGQDGYPAHVGPPEQKLAFV